jgi:ATP-dependent protease ClpP protease subunit
MPKHYLNITKTNKTLSSQNPTSKILSSQTPSSKSFNSSKKNHAFAKGHEEEIELEEESPTALGFFQRFRQNRCLIVPIDEGVKEASYYRSVTYGISELSEGDIVEFNINSPGGNLNGLIALLSAISETDAHVIANITGECHSAASILALNCDEIRVSPHCTMLVHHVSFSTGGKAADIRAYVNHLNENTEELLRKTYTNFLSEVEIENVLNGLQLWLDADEVISRLEKKQEIEYKEFEEAKELKLKELAEEMEDLEEEIINLPKSKPKKKKS